MHYLITGGCGFIGTYLVNNLLAAGHRLTILDDLSNSKRENCHAGVKLVVEDITTPGVLDDLVADIDGCFHLAAIVSVVQSTEWWLRTHQVTLGGTVALFDALARRKRRVPVVYASSAAVYGDCADIPLSESSRCTPISAYGADKLACELHGRIGVDIHAIPNIGLRFFNVYGAGQDPSSPYAGVISIFANLMKKNAPVTVYGDGEQTRDYVYVGDIVEGMLLSMRKLEDKSLTHGVFNLGTGVQTSVNSLAKTIAAITGTASAAQHAPYRPSEARVSVASVDMSKKILGFTARTPLKDGLEKTLTSF